MDPKFQTSFIPKKPLIQASHNKPVHTTNLFNLISTIIFVTVLILAGGVWAYKIYLTKHNQELAVELDKQLTQFEPELIATLSREDARIEASKDLLNNHVALTSLFTFLGNVTLKTVRFNTFSYTPDSKDSTKIAISMAGEAESFAAVALQADIFRNEINRTYLQNATFSNFGLDEAGNVNFSFSGVIDQTKISYRSYINNLQALSEGNTIVATSTIQ